MAESGRNSLAGNNSISSREATERWSPTENSAIRSTSSPQKSMRTGAAVVEG